MSQVNYNSGRLIEALKSLGLTKYEGLVYIGLMQFDGATATEIHENSGVPRASVYPVLDKLVQKGLVIVSNASPKRFEALPPKDGIIKLKENIKINAELAQTELEAIYIQKLSHEKEKQELIWSISGPENIVNKLKVLIDEARSDLKIISEWEFINTNIKKILENNSNLKTDIITDRWVGEIPKGTTVKIVEDKLCDCFESGQEMSGIYIIDSKKVLVIMSSPENEPSAMFSESNGFRNFFSNYWNFVSYHIAKKHKVNIHQKD